MAGNTGGPWGGGGQGGGGNRGDDDRNGGGNRGGRRPGEGPQIPEIDEIMKKGQEHLRVLMGGRGGRGTGGGGPAGPAFNARTALLGILALAVIWAYASFYTVKPEQRSVELFLGKFYRIGQPGLNFAPWPLVSATVLPVTAERTTDIGSGSSGSNDSGLMLTRDQNIVDVHFQVVWNVSNPATYLFNLADPADTIRAVSESAMRDIIARTELSPILNKDRGAIAADLRQSVQTTLDSYHAGINVIRVNFDSADPPKEVIDSFREVQAAQQQRDRLEKEADAYANKAVAAARGEAAQIKEEAEGYRAQVVNVAEGEASRFDSIYKEYVKAPGVTRKRMYLDAMTQILGGMHKVLLDGVSTGDKSGVVPYLPLSELMKQASPAASGAAAASKAANTGSTSTAATTTTTGNGGNN